MRTLLLVSLLALCCCHSCDPGAEAAPTRPNAEINHEQAPHTAPAYLRLASGLDPVHTLNRWLLLEQAHDAQEVSLAPYLAGDVTLVVPGATPATRVQELATRFGAEAAPLDVRPAQLLRPSLQQAGAATPVFAAPGDTDAVRVLPAHAILIRLDGPLPGAESTPSGFAWVAITRTDGGYVRADALTPYRGCVPTAERFVADLPISDGHSHEVRATVSRVRASFGGEVQDAFLFASQDRHEDEEEEDEEDEEIEGKHGGGVGLYPTDARCQLAEGFSLSFGHVVEQVDLVPGAAREASLLSVVLSEGDDELETKLFRVGTQEALFERELEPGTGGPWPVLSLPSP